MPTNADLFARACAVMPGGVSSPVRAFGAVGGNPRTLVKAQGAWLTDAEGKRYVDLVGSWGPMICGHAHPSIMNAVQAAVADSTSFGASCERELLLAEAICARVEPVEKVRFTSSGTEAVMTALRLARAATGRDVIIKFAGCYHGHSDAMLVAAGSGVASLGLPNSPGVASSVAATTVVVPYGDLDAVAQVFAERPSEIAGVLVEGVPANMGVIVPPEGFNAGLAKLCHDNGALLILDEVLTGFRMSSQGYWGFAGKAEGWTPDLITMGKVIGGGLPLAAVGGKAEIMDLLAPLGPVYQAGTLSGNPAAAAAGLATLQLLDDDAYTRLDELADQISDMACTALAAKGIPHRLNKVGNLFSIFFTDQPVVNFATASAQDTAAFASFFHQMLDAGVWLPPSAYEAWFVSTALSDQELDVIRRALG